MLKNAEQIRLEKICNTLKKFKTKQWHKDKIDFCYYVIKDRLKFGLTGSFTDVGNDEVQVEDISLYVTDEETSKVIESYENVRPPYLLQVFETLSKEEAESKAIDAESKARARLDKLLDK